MEISSRTGDFTWTAGLTASHVKSTVTKLYGGQNIDMELNPQEVTHVRNLSIARVNRHLAIYGRNGQVWRERPA